MICFDGYLAVVKLEVAHRLEAGEDGLKAVKLSDAERWQPVRVSAGALPGNKGTTSFKKALNKQVCSLLRNFADEN